MAYVLVTPPAAEPVSLAEAKLHLRVDVADDDALITAFIVAARQFAEMRTQRQFVTAQWKLVLDSFPAKILLDKSPIASIQSIQYLDMSGVLQTVPSADYVFESSSEPARIAPIFGKIWPIPVPQIGAVQVNFTSGYGNAAAVPEGIKSWMKVRIGSLYQHREEMAVLASGKIEPLPFIYGLLDPFCVVSY